MDERKEDRRSACTPEMIQKHEAMLISNKIMLTDFLERYDRDRLECAERYRSDREEAREWRQACDIKLQNIEFFIQEMKPNYRLAIYLIGTVVIGSLGLIFKVIWDHTTQLR